MSLNLLFGVVYYRIADGSSSQGGVQSLVAAVFMCAAFASMVRRELGEVAGRGVGAAVVCKGQSISHCGTSWLQPWRPVTVQPVFVVAERSSRVATS